MPKLSPSALFGITFILGLVFSWLHTWRMTDYMDKELILTIGVILLLISLLLNTIAYRGFKKYLTPHAPFLTPTVLLQSGVFAFSRNPVYLALILSQLGLAFVFDSIWLLLCSVVLFFALDYFVVSQEEKLLAHTFKETYLRYKRVTRRWL